MFMQGGPSHIDLFEPKPELMKLDEKNFPGDTKYENRAGAKGRAGVGRDHNTYGFSMWVAGGGFKAGHAHGATDEFGHHAVKDVVNHSDYHATLLHLFGLDAKSSATNATAPSRSSSRIPRRVWSRSCWREIPAIGSAAQARSQIPLCITTEIVSSLIVVEERR